MSHRQSKRERAHLRHAETVLQQAKRQGDGTTIVQTRTILSSEERRDPLANQRAELQTLASRIRSQEHLDEIVAKLPEDQRETVYNELVRLGDLPFADYAYEPTPDCPNCGLRRGSVIPHSC
jgi:hypothetical protein